MPTEFTVAFFAVILCVQIDRLAEGLLGLTVIVTVILFGARNKTAGDDFLVHL